MENEKIEEIGISEIDIKFEFKYRSCHGRQI